MKKAIQTLCWPTEKQERRLLRFYYTLVALGVVFLIYFFFFARFQYIDGGEALSGNELYDVIYNFSADTQRTLRAGINDKEASIPIGEKVYKADFPLYWSTFVSNNPELSIERKITYKTNNQGRVISILPTYITQSEEDEAAFTKMIDEWAEFSKGIKTRTEVLELINEFVVRYFVYEKEPRSFATAIRERQGNCESYTALFVWLADYERFDVRTVSSRARRHIWVQVNLDNEWLNIDPTFNDPIIRRNGVVVKDADNSSYWQDYFLLTDEEMLELI